MDKQQEENLEYQIISCSIHCTVTITMFIISMIMIITVMFTPTGKASPQAFKGSPILQL